MAEFLNAYNFIPFPEKKSGCYKNDETDRHTGVITYRITTKTPLFIPNTSSRKAFKLDAREGDKLEEHESYDFYSYRELEQDKTYNDDPDVPVIPGSELRGMFRGIYETLTDSCMGVLNANEYPVKRTAEMFLSGLLVRKGDGYVLVNAEDCIYRESDDLSYKTFEKTNYKEGQELYVKVVPRYSRNRTRIKSLIKDCSVKKDQNHPSCGYIIKGVPDGELNKKHNAHIFLGDSRKTTEIKIGQENIEQLKRVLASYQKQLEKPDYAEYEENLNLFLEGELKNSQGKAQDKYPVYYSMLSSQGLLYLSPACYTKEVSHYSVGELAGDMKPCTEEAGLCPACDLFGMVGTSNDSAHASLIRFSDAYVEPEKEKADYYESYPYITLENLAEPRLGNTEFYLQQPSIKDENGELHKADFWTYDYFIVDGKVYEQPGKLRGRKYYWHQPNMKLSDSVKRTGQNKTVRPVRANKCFTAKMFFDGITQIQLEQLKWMLNCGQNDSGLAYKLGGGKPLGLGSVQCEVLEIRERKVVLENGNLNYQEEKWPDDKKGTDIEICRYEEAGFSKTCKKEFMLMSSFDAASNVEHISYPFTADQLEKPREEGFKWYSEWNHRYFEYKRGQLNQAEYTSMAQKRIQIKTLCALPMASELSLLPCNPVPERSSSTVKTAKVVGYRERRDGKVSYVYIEVEGVRGRRSLWSGSILDKEKIALDDLKEKFSIGTLIRVNYTGKSEGTDGKLYDNYEYVGKSVEGIPG